jgi:hypothetical protein
MEFTDAADKNAPGSFVTSSRLKAWMYSSFLGHRVVTKYLTPAPGPFGALSYRRRYVLSPGKRRGSGSGRTAMV